MERSKQRRTCQKRRYQFWLKNNPNYYFVIYHFNGLKANMTKRDSLDGLEMWMTPPAETENKTQIAFCESNRVEAGQMLQQHEKASAASEEED